MEFIGLGAVLRNHDPQQGMIAIHPMNENGSVREFNEASWMSFGDYQLGGLSEPVDLELAPSGADMKARRWNPCTGEFTPLEFTPDAGRFSYRPPDGQEWWSCSTNCRMKR